MIKLKFALLASSISLDQQTNTLSILHALDSITVPSVPFTIPSMVIVAVFRKEQGSSDLVKVSEAIVSPSGKRYEIKVPEMNFGGKLINRFLMTVNGFKFEEFGTYKFVLEWEGKTAEIEFEVFKQKTVQNLGDYLAANAPS